MELKSIILACCVCLEMFLDVKSVRFCMSCYAATPTNCDVKTKKCTIPECSKMKKEKCQKRSDVCIASWTPTKQGIVKLAGCFPLPPLSGRAKYSKTCQPWNRNGTYTCLCRRNGCNKIPLPRPTVPTAVTSGLRTSDAMESTQISQTNLYTGDEITRKPPTLFSLRWILIIISSMLFLIIILSMFYAASNVTKTTTVYTKSVLVHDQSQSDSTNLEVVAIPRHLPELNTLISEGAFCNVWRGNFRGVDVAVKCLSIESKRLWINECKIYSKLNHKNIATYIAASDPINSVTQMWLATKYCENGTLKTYLESHHLSWERLLTMARDITAGLSFLHSDRLSLGSSSMSAIAHQDLKSNNILIDGNGTCVIADFGLSLELTQDFSQHVYQNGQVGTIRYMAPEKLEARIDIENPESFKQIDVYSLALVLWELLTRCHQCTCMDYLPPYQDLTESHPALSQMIDIVSMNGCRPKQPKILSEKSEEDVQCLWTTIKECWDQDPEARLTADCVLLRLETLITLTTS